MLHNEETMKHTQQQTLGKSYDDIHSYLLYNLSQYKPNCKLAGGCTWKLDEPNLTGLA